MDYLPRRSGEFKLYPHRAFQLCGVCPKPLFTRRNRALLELVVTCDAFNRVTCPAEYYALPNIYVEACEVILPILHAARLVAQARAAK